MGAMCLLTSLPLTCTSDHRLGLPRHHPAWSLISGRAEVQPWGQAASSSPPQAHCEGPMTCQSQWQPWARSAWGSLSSSLSLGAGSPGSRLAAAVAFLSEEASLRRLLTLPVCNTHYQNDRVFSLITHYFYAERRFLTKGKNNSNNIHIYGAANSLT